MHLLLVHGLGRTTLSLAGLARALRRAGHTTETFGYVGALESFPRIRDRLRARLERIAASGRRYGVLGHSLGGVLLRAALPGVQPPPQHLVMLATPNRPPRLAHRFRGFVPFRLATGDPGRRLGDPHFFADLPPPPVPYTIIAGTAGSRGRLSPFGSEPNDWIVSVGETLVFDADRPVLVPVGHTFMMAGRAVRAAVLRAFGPAAEPPPPTSDPDVTAGRPAR